MNVTDLGTPLGNIQNATLYLNTCHSNSSGSWLGNIRFGDKRIPGTSATLVGSKETLMQSFFNNYNFKNVRGTGAGVSYNRCLHQRSARLVPSHAARSWSRPPRC